MKTRIKTTLLLVNLLIGSSGLSAAAERDYTNPLTDSRFTGYSQDLIVNNYYPGDGYDMPEFYYASRIRRFHRPMATCTYYHSYYTDMYWYTYDPIYWGYTIYSGSFWNPVLIHISFGGPVWAGYRYNPFYYSWYRPVIYSSYYYGPAFQVHPPHFVTSYYVGNWYYTRPYRTVYYSRPYYARHATTYDYYSRPSGQLYTSGRGYTTGNSAPVENRRTDNRDYTGQRRPSTGSGQAVTPGTRQATGNERTVNSAAEGRNREVTSPDRAATRTPSRTEGSTSVETRRRSPSQTVSGSAQGQRSETPSRTTTVTRSPDTGTSTSGKRSSIRKSAEQERGNSSSGKTGVTRSTESRSGSGDKVKRSTGTEKKSAGTERPSSRSTRKK